MVLDFLTRLQDFTEVLMSDPHILMDRRLKFFRDFLVAMGADETFLLTTTGEQEELDRSELFDALEACSYGNFFLRQGKYTDAIDAFTNASQLASNVRYFDEAKLSAYQQMTSEYVPSSVEDISNIVDEIPLEDNISKNLNFTTENSLFRDSNKVENKINRNNVNQNPVYNSPNSIFENCKKNNEDLDADDFEDYPMETVNNQIYPTDTRNQYFQVVPSSIMSTSNQKYVKFNTENVNRKRSNPSKRPSNIHQPQSPTSLSRLTSAKPYYRQPVLPQTVVSKSTRYNNSSFNNDGFQICASNVKQNQNFDLEKELKEIDEMNDAIDKLF